MKKVIFSPPILALLFLTATNFYLSALPPQAEKPNVNKWTFKNPFEQKVFIENKGQFTIDEKSVKTSDIFFGARQDGLFYYFTKNGIWIKHTTKVKRTEKEIEVESEKHGIKSSKEEKGEEEFAFKSVDEYYRMEFSGAGLNTEIISVDEVSQQYNFGSNNNRNISTHAYKKIIYKNLYPGIDMEIYFPDDKQGFKYNLILQPGANPNQIQIKYPLNAGLTLSDNGNVLIKSPFGNFTDHAPIASETSNSKSIDCSFNLKNGVVQFNIPNYNSSKALTIDPWTTTPIFSAGGDAYDVDWDNAGNCYAYGGTFPYQLIKFNNAGVMVWSFTTTSFTTSLGYYGDFAVDRNTGTCYIVDGFNVDGAQVIKTNSGGVQTAFYSGDPSFREMWRIAFSRCTGQAVIAGGGTTSPSYTGCFLDTNLTNMNLVNVMNISAAGHDMCGVTLDNFGNCYMNAARPFTSDGLYDNVIMKLPLPNLGPQIWTANTNFQFIEVSSVSYTGANGFNGMSMSNLDLYNYDSYVLQEWNSGAGTLIGAVNVNGASQSTMAYGGITADDCDHLFLGLNNTIVQYNSLVSAGLIATMSGNVFDVALNKNSVLFSCGAGFVAATTVSLPPCSIINATNQITNSNCTLSTGSATITVSGGTSPYTITWNTTPVQTGPTAINLPPGTYVATITDSSCTMLINFDTVVIADLTSLPLLAVNSATICNGASIILTATGAATYTWSAGATSTGVNTATASPSTTTTYTVIGTDGICIDSVFATITVNPNPTPTITSSGATVFCSGDSVILDAGAGYSAYSWSNGATTQTIIINTSGNYSVTVTDANGCTGSTSSATTVTVNLSPIPIITVGPTTICAGGNVILNAGTGYNTYSWSNGASSQTTNVTSSGLYSVTVTDANGCSGFADTSITVTVSANLLPIITSSGATIFCSGDSVTLDAGTGYFTYAWSNGATSQTIVVGNSGNYSVTVTDANGCSGSSASAVTLTVNPNPVPTITANGATILCSGGNVILDAGTGYNTYVWSNGVTLQTTNATSTGSYSVTITDANGCTGSSSISITVNPLPVADTTSTVLINANCGESTGSISGITVTSGQPSYTYVWNDAFGTIVGTGSPNLINIGGGVYSLTITDANGCSTVAGPFTITTTVGVTAAFTSSLITGEPPLTVDFTNGSIGAVNYLWQFGTGDTSTFTNPSYVFIPLGDFTVCLIANNAFGCYDTACSVIDIYLNSIFIIPNIFTPNDDNINDVFTVQCIGLLKLDAEIYNRWGQKQFEWHTVNGGWDGRSASGVPASDGTYYYIITAKGIDGKEYSKQGAFSLIRGKK